MKKSKLQLVLVGMFGLGAIGCLIQFQLISALAGAVVAYLIYKHEPKQKQPKQKKVKEPKQKKVQDDPILKAFEEELEALNNEPMFDDECMESRNLKRRIAQNNQEYWSCSSADEFGNAIVQLKHLYKQANEKAKHLNINDEQYQRIFAETMVAEMHIIHPEWKQGYILMHKHPKEYITDEQYIENEVNKMMNPKIVKH